MPYLFFPRQSFEPIGVECDVCEEQLITGINATFTLPEELGWYDNQAGPDQVILCPECAVNLDESLERVYEERED